MDCWSQKGAHYVTPGPACLPAVGGLTPGPCPAMALLSHRGVLHPTVCALRADWSLALRPGPLQAVVGGGLPALHLLCLQYRTHQL